ncbi:hypothetical protein QBC46DRAFT_399104 [Diplogelasinospora grovesii]|uniref:Uncharacterized protein n=1 Tax=Diplogelasinospora grovesii TaxID=303347 RepID=A0AAN6S001_9PEZI|nr:hypothetical protein QBC46DRAFT_399104 [Diplogelasinospora grovesii]
MTSDDSVNDWSSGDEAGLPNDESQPVRGTRPAQRGQLRPARKTLPFVPYADWVPGQSYKEQPPFCMHYILEWKLTLNKRVAAKQTDDDLVVAPSDFWNEELASKIADIVKIDGQARRLSSPLLQLLTSSSMLPLLL